MLACHPLLEGCSVWNFFQAMNAGRVLSSLDWAWAANKTYREAVAQPGLCLTQGWRMALQGEKLKCLNFIPHQKCIGHYILKTLECLGEN